MTKMAAVPIYSKNTLKMFFPGTSGLISTKLAMKHHRLRPIIFCSNDKPGLTLAYFIAMSNFAAYAFNMGKCDNDGH